MQEYEEQEDEFKQSTGGWWIRVIGIIVYMAIIVAYAVQTLELVNWLFPDANWFMMIVTVFVCDGCATGYAMAEMFYRFRLKRAKGLVFGMWVVTFALSTAATVIQMYLSSTHHIPHSIDPTVISVAYGLIILAFVVNIIAITVIIRMEYNASQPQHRYLDDGKKKSPVMQQQPGRATHMLPNGDEIAVYAPNQQIAQQHLNKEIQPTTGQLKQTFTREEVQGILSETAGRSYQAGMEYGPSTQPAAFMKKMRDATNPLPKSPLDSQASHEGNQNGKQ